jgi:sialic acid synthase SpsE
MFFIEAGINHFGSEKLAKKIVNFFLKSSFKNLTFMLHTRKIYDNFLKQGMNFELSIEFYKHLIYTCHKNKKKVGLSVCDMKTFRTYKNLNFDFYKLMSLSINNFELINELKKKNKPIYISTGFKSKLSNIKKCIKAFKNKRKLILLHTPMTYKISELNFPNIDYLRKKFKLDVGYSNHSNNINSLNVLSAYNPKVVFLYCKPQRSKTKVYPDDGHALYLDELEKVKKNYIDYLKANTFNKKLIKVNIFQNEVKK